MKIKNNEIDFPILLLTKLVLKNIQLPYFTTCNNIFLTYYYLQL